MNKSDGPSTRRMGFGYQQASAAGSPYMNPRDVTDVNFELRERHAAKRLRELVEAEPWLGKRIEEGIREKHSARLVLLELTGEWDNSFERVSKQRYDLFKKYK